MAATVTGTPSKSSAKASSLTWSHTNPAGGTHLIVFSATGSSSGAGDTTGITFNGDALTAIASSSFTDSNWCQIEAWAMDVPDVATGNISITLGGAVTLIAGVGISVTGEHDSVPLGTAGGTNGSSASTAPSASISSDSGDLVLAGLFTDDNAGVAVTGGGTELAEVENIDSDSSISAQSQAGATTSTTVSWSQGSEKYAIAGVAVKPAAGAAGQPITKRLGGVQFTASRAPAQQGMRQF